VIQRVALPRSRHLVDLAEIIGSLEPMLSRVPSPLASQAVRRGESDTPSHFFYGPRFPLSAGSHQILFWLRVRSNAWSPRLVFDAASWIGDTARILGDYVTALSCGSARTVIYPLSIEVFNSEQVELRAWSDANSGDLRVMRVDVHHVPTSPAIAEPARRRTSWLPWRRLAAEAFAVARKEFVELWLAFYPCGCAGALFTLSNDEGAKAVIEVPDIAAMAPFILPDGRLLLSLRFATDIPSGLAGRYHVTVSTSGLTIDLGIIEIPKPTRGDVFGHPPGSIWPNVSRLDLAPLEEPSPELVEIVAVERKTAGDEGEVTILDYWLDFPLMPADLDQAVVAGNFFWDPSGLKLRRGFARFPTGRCPALRLACIRNGGKCIIRHRNRDIEVDLRSPEPEFLLVFPTLAEPVLSTKSCPMVGDVHPAFEHLFRRLRAPWSTSRS
jgi:hypothetical protein